MISSNQKLGSGLNRVITLVVFYLLFSVFGMDIFDSIIISTISVFIAYPLVGFILRSTGVWHY